MIPAHAPEPFNQTPAGNEELMAQSALRPLSVGEILDGAFALYRRHFSTFLVAQVTILAPAILLGFLDTTLANFLFILLNLAAVSAAIWQMSEGVLGRKPDFGGALRMAVNKFLPVLGASIVLGFLLIVGIIFFVIPGFIFLIMFFATPYVVVLENNFKYCLQRSRDLAKKSWRKIGLVYLISTLIAAVPGAAFGVARVGVSFWNLKPGEPFKPNEIGPLGFALQILVQALITPFSVGVMTLLYYDQRVRKEGLDVELAAAAIREQAGPAGRPAPPPGPAANAEGAPELIAP